MSATIHNVCRYRAGPFFSNHEASAATAKIAAICQEAFNTKLKMSSLAACIAFFLFDQLTKARKLFRRQVFRLKQTHDETFSRAPKQTIDKLPHGVPRKLGARHSRRVNVCFVLERALYLLLPVQHGKHCLHGGVSQFALELALDGLD